MPLTMWIRSLQLLVLCVLLSAAGGCKRAYDVGDHVLVEWEKEIHPAVIIEVPGPGKVKIHYDGYDEMWDEVIPRSRLKGRVEGEPPSPEMPEKVRRTTEQAAKTNHFKINDRVKVEWHGHFYPARVIGIVGPERYQIRYEGYGDEWNENVSRDRMSAR